jgi:hypothetical protein
VPPGSLLRQAPKLLCWRRRVQAACNVSDYEVLLWLLLRRRAARPRRRPLSGASAQP